MSANRTWLCGDNRPCAGMALEVGFLCSRNQNTTVSDCLQHSRLLRYLKGHPSVGPIISAQPGPVELIGFSDASRAVHTDGASHTGNTLSIGLNNAAFTTSSVAERSSVSPDRGDRVQGSRAPSEENHYGILSPATHRAWLPSKQIAYQAVPYMASLLCI